MFFSTAAVGEEGNPSLCDLLVGPGIGDIGSGAEGFVVMVMHDAEGADVDGKYGCEELEAVREPLAAM